MADGNAHRKPRAEAGRLAFPLAFFYTLAGAVPPLLFLAFGFNANLCTRWATLDLPGSSTLGCASKIFLATLFALALIGPIFIAMWARFIPALGGYAREAGIGAQFAIFFMLALFAFETIARAVV